MIRLLFVLLIGLVCLVRLVSAHETDVEEQQVDFGAEEIEIILTHANVPSLPVSDTNKYSDNAAAAHLGRFLFFDERYSGDGLVSCATCHMPGSGFATPLAHGQGTGVTKRHPPTLWNVGYQRWFNWDGSRDSMWSQAIGPIEDPNEMSGDRTELAQLVRDDRDLFKAYENVFGPFPESLRGELPQRARPIKTDHEPDALEAWSGLTDQQQNDVNLVLANIAKAFEAYQRQLIRLNAPFDQFARSLQDKHAGNPNALSTAAKRGLKLFISEDVHCRSCHMGPMFTDLEFHSLGLTDAAGRPPHDSGRYDGVRILQDDMFNAKGPFSDDVEGPTARRTSSVIHSPDTWGQFKTPSLRNVAISAPYMHEGHFDTLQDVLHFYSTLEGQADNGHHQEFILVPLELSERQKADLIAFLRSLTGSTRNRSLSRAPASPILPIEVSAIHKTVEPNVREHTNRH